MKLEFRGRARVDIYDEAGNHLATTETAESRLTAEWGAGDTLTMAIPIDMGNLFGVDFPPAFPRPAGDRSARDEPEPPVPKTWHDLPSLLR